MNTFDVITGLGYFRDESGHIVAKAQLPAGTHYLKDGYTYIEVGTLAELNAVVIYVDPAEALKQQNEQKIQTKIRAMTRAAAIIELIASSDLPADYVDE